MRRDDEVNRMFTPGRYQLPDGTVGTYVDALRAALAHNTRKRDELNAKIARQEAQLEEALRCTCRHVQGTESTCPVHGIHP